MKRGKDNAFEGGLRLLDGDLFAAVREYFLRYWSKNLSYYV